MKDLEGFEYGYYSGSYSTLINSFEVEVLLEVSDGDYQGDTRYLLRDGDRYGFLVFGWGSCSGCDALQACDNIEEAQELRDQLWRGVRWEDSREALAKYFNEKDWDLEWHWHADEMKEFITKAKELLNSDVLV